MDDIEFKGAANRLAGSAEKAVGDVIGDNGLQGQGLARQVIGEVQADLGRVQAVAEDVADKVSDRVAKAAGPASAAVATVADKASGVYEHAAESAAETAHRAAGVIGPFVQKRPYAALSIVAAVGIVVGLLVAARAPKAAYVRRLERT